MTFEERIQKAREYYQKSVTDAAELVSLRERIESIKTAISGLSGIPTLTKLAAFLTSIKSIVGVE